MMGVLNTLLDRLESPAPDSGAALLARSEAIVGTLEAGEVARLVDLDVWATLVCGDQRDGRQDARHQLGRLIRLERKAPVRLTDMWIDYSDGPWCVTVTGGAKAPAGPVHSHQLSTLVAVAYWVRGGTFDRLAAIPGRERRAMLESDAQVLAVEPGYYEALLQTIASDNEMNGFDDAFSAGG